LAACRRKRWSIGWWAWARSDRSETGRFRREEDAAEDILSALRGPSTRLEASGAFENPSTKVKKHA